MENSKVQARAARWEKKSNDEPRYFWRIMELFTLGKLRCISILIKQVFTYCCWSLTVSVGKVQNIINKILYWSRTFFFFLVCSHFFFSAAARCMCVSTTLIRLHISLINSSHAEIKSRISIFLQNSLALSFTLSVSNVFFIHANFKPAQRMRARTEKMMNINHFDWVCNWIVLIDSCIVRKNNYYVVCKRAIWYDISCYLIWYFSPSQFIPFNDDSCTFVS